MASDTEVLADARASMLGAPRDQALWTLAAEWQGLLLAVPMDSLGSGAAPALRSHSQPNFAATFPLPVFHSLGMAAPDAAHQLL